jgi:hypothetical protein
MMRRSRGVRVSRMSSTSTPSIGARRGVLRPDRAEVA